MCDMNPNCDSDRLDQTGVCADCGSDPKQRPMARFSGGAGARTHPLSDEDYRRQRRKLERRAGE
jgi:hypothetical protein